MLRYNDPTLLRLNQIWILLLVALHRTYLRYATSIRVPALWYWIRAQFNFIYFLYSIMMNASCNYCICAHILLPYCIYALQYYDSIYFVALGYTLWWSSRTYARNQAYCDAIRKRVTILIFHLFFNHFWKSNQFFFLFHSATQIKYRSTSSAFS